MSHGILGRVMWSPSDVTHKMREGLGVESAHPLTQGLCITQGDSEGTSHHINDYINKD